MKWMEPKSGKKLKKVIFFRDCCIDILKAKRTLQRKNRAKNGGSYEEWLAKVCNEDDNINK